MSTLPMEDHDLEVLRGWVGGGIPSLLPVMGEVVYGMVYM